LSEPSGGIIHRAISSWVQIWWVQVWLVRLLAILGLVLAAATAIPPQWYAGFLAQPWTEEQGAVLVVLGGDALEDGSLAESSLWRCVFAVKVWREGGFERLVVSGNPADTAAMRDYLTWRGIPFEAIVIENHSLSTRENALHTARLAQGMRGPFVLLTSDFHMWRAWRAFAKAGLDIAPRPCPDAFKRSRDWRNRWRVFLDLTLELVKIGYYQIRGWA
jgi:uncharacterized SAM-binding protein YcdF (DUF218 family)